MRDTTRALLNVVGVVDSTKQQLDGALSVMSNSVHLTEEEYNTLILRTEPIFNETIEKIGAKIEEAVSDLDAQTVVDFYTTGVGSRVVKAFDDRGQILSEINTEFQMRAFESMTAYLTEIGKSPVEEECDCEKHD